MYLQLAQPTAEEGELLCRRDELLLRRALTDATRDLAECRKRLDAAAAALKAARRKTRQLTKGRPREGKFSRP
jgi:hypothetical protein